MLWVGITGDIGAGKSTVVDLLRQKSYPVLNADEVVHQLYKQDLGLQKSIQNLFGDDAILNSDVNRHVLAGKIKADASLLSKLEELVHPLVKKSVSQWKESVRQNDIAFYEVPLLYEKKMEEDFDFVLYVESDDEIAQERLMDRNNWSAEEVKERRSWLLDKKQKIKLADFVIVNNGDHDLLDQQLQIVLKKFTKSVHSQY